MRYRPEWLSEGAEVLVARLGEDPPPVYDVVVVGSGYGGAVAAARFAGAEVRGQNRRLTVCVLERGNEYVVGSFPNRLAELPGYVRYSRYDDPKLKGRRDGLFDLRIGADVTVLVASGLGGGSLINAAVAERATEALRNAAWPDGIRGDLDQYYERAEAMLSVNAPPREYPKYKAFREFVGGRSGSGMTVDAARPARVAISFQDRRPNDQGVAQRPCIGCGDCVTGCNFGAKNTLAMNYLPDAKRNGAKIYTGATVLYVEQRPEDEGARWRVAFRLTAEKGPGRAEQPHLVRARHVVLAAGALGSPEILMRSRARGLRLSDRLGQRFSTNGDMIGALYDQPEKVNAAAREHTAFAERNVGPTITGIAQATTSSRERLTLEELAIPGALRRIFEEVVTSAALAARLGRFDWSTHAPRDPDPVAVDPAAIDRTQIFAAFGDDGARGRLEMVNGWETSDWDGAIQVVWPGAAAERVYALEDRLLGFDRGSGGLYLRSPLWRPLPEALSAALSGAKPEGKLFSVHPLGGCPMGNDCEAGVVDDIGRVFDPQGRTTPYEGLLVLDGSIVPGALAMNPLLTIAALAERAAKRYADAQGWKLDAKQRVALADPPGVLVEQPPEPQTRIRFAERMAGPLEFAGEFSPRVECALEIEFKPIGPIPEFLRGGHEVTPARASLVAAGAPAELNGAVYWLELGRTGAIRRTACALWTWLRTRALADVIQRVRERSWAGLRGLSLRGLTRLASNVGEVRYLRYELTLGEALRSNGEVLLRAGTKITGLKTFRYAVGGNPWRQLSELSVTVTPPGGAARSVGTLTLDPLHLLRRYAAQLQIVAQQDAPTAWVDVASIALYMARVILKVHFWSFRLPEYEKHDPARARRRLPAKLPDLEHFSHTVHVKVDGRDDMLALPLTNYRRAGAKAAELKGPVVLFHGFGSSGAQFAFHGDGLPKNLVTHLARDGGFDVWVPELRTSIGVPSSWDQWTLDEVARNDIPSIVDLVLDKTRAPQVDVVAHCIGSAMFCTAALDGRLLRGPSPEAETPPASKIRRAVLLQVGPLVTLSEANKANARVVSFLRRYAEVDHVDSSVDDWADWVDALVDRLLYTYPYPPDEAEHHRLWPPWARHKHIANCNRSAGVFGRLFEHRNVSQEMLDALGDLIGHANLTTFEQTLQYAFLERLTDQNATNAYVTLDNVRGRFRFPVRFLHGQRNEVFHPDTSVRSRRLLNEVNPGTADLVPLEGYGHLDPLIGREAHQEVFPSISEFLARPAQERGAPARAPAGDEADKASKRFGRWPLVGPVLGWTRWAGGQWWARVWCRVDDTRVDPSFVMTISYSGGSAGVAHRRNLSELIPPFGERGEALDRGARVDGIETLVAVDVPLGARSADIEIVIASAYDEPGAAAIRHAAEDARAIEAERVAWRERVKSAQAATRTVDAGYDGQINSVMVRKAVLDALDSKRTSLSFAVGSCRYAASVVDREAADFMFGKLRRLIEEAAADSPALLLLVGDQIYADATAGMFDPKTSRERFYESYHEAWSAPNARAVLRQIPTYMMMDDHEVEDNWSRAQTDNATRQAGLEAFEGYQWLHSPRNAAQLLGAPRADGKYFYGFEAAGVQFFVCDTRSGRNSASGITDHEQLEALKTWLSANRGDRHKFIVSPSLIVPFRKDTQRGAGADRDAYLRRSDGWDGFPGSLRTLMSHIQREQIGNVVFLCGDAHRSMASRIWFVDRAGGVVDLGTRCIVSSPLYAPFPFANSQAEEFADVGELDLDDGGRMHYAVQDGSIGQDSFAVVQADARGMQNSLSVRFHCRDGTVSRPTLSARSASPSVAQAAQVPGGGAACAGAGPEDALSKVPSSPAP